MMLTSTLRSATLVCALMFLCPNGFGQSEGLTRTVGPEPGLQFGVVPSGVNECEYGEYVRSANSGFGGNCANFIKGDDTWLMDATTSSQSFTYLPFSEVQKYIVTLTHNGVSGQKAVVPYLWNKSPVPSWVTYGFNIADPSFVSYVFDKYIPYDLLPHGPNAKNKIPTDAAHPTYVEIDAFCADYRFYGVLNNYSHPTSYTQSGVTWDEGFPQSANEWYQGWKTFFAYAKTNHPEIRLSPHMSSLSDWAMFQSVFADVPSLMKEPFQIGDAFNHNQLYSQIQNSYWFANVAPPVFNNEPRVISWGTWVDNGDIHTALALYLLIRGPNTFFDALVTNPQRGVDPKLWLPIVNKLGIPSGSSTVQVLATARNHAVGDGYNLLARTYSGGVAYLNMTGSSQTIKPPAGGTDWQGKSVSSIMLADGKGEVVLAQVSATGSAKIALSPATLSFGNQDINTTGTAQMITLSNTGTALLSISSVAVTGTDSTDFHATNSCAPSVAPGANCAISVTFTPASTGARSASLSVTDNATGSPHAIRMGGMGVSASQPAIYQPLNGATVTDHFTIGAVVKNVATTISHVEFYDNGKFLGTTTVNAQREYLRTWQKASAGKHSLTAVATDVAGNKTISPAVYITVK